MKRRSFFSIVAAAVVAPMTLWGLLKRPKKMVRIAEVWSRENGWSWKYSEAFPANTYTNRGLDEIAGGVAIPKETVDKLNAAMAGNGRNYLLTKDGLFETSADGNRQISWMNHA